jgi:amino acid adenylation domain-containing protein
MKLPLSKIQEQFWVLGNLYPNTPAYNIPLVYKLSGKLRIPEFKQALIQVLNMHPVLCAKISIFGHLPLMNISSDININDYFNDFYIKDKFSNEYFKEYILNEIHRGFNLHGGFLTRIRFVSFSDVDYLVFVFHHIVIDHHSKSIFLSDISRCYSSLINKIPFNCEGSSAKYDSFIHYEKNWLCSDRAKKMIYEWKSVFNDNINQIDLPFDRNNEITFKSVGKRLHFSLHYKVSNQIDKFASENNINPFVFLLSVYALFLSRIGEQTTFAIGVPLSNRRNEEYKNTVGCFVNILPVIIRLDNKDTFSNILKQVRSELLKNHRRQEISLVELQTIYNENQKGYPFHVGFTFEEPVEFYLENIILQSQIIEREGSQLELFLTLWKSNNGFQGFWEFNTDKFNDITIHRFIDIFKNIVSEVIKSPEKQYLDYQILPVSDKRLIETVNNTRCPYSDSICIHQVFENRVIMHPNRVALLDGDSELSYNELNIHVNRLANYLIENNTQVGDIIAIACERRAEMIISILAVLKSGAAYLPIQISNPPQVIQEIIDNANPKYILTSTIGSSNINDKERIISIQDILQVPLSVNINNPNINVNSNNLAYTIYTSGSTGQPKGVAIKHHSVINRLEWMQKSYPLTEKDVLLQKTPITFDVSVWELFWWFFGGAKLSLLAHNGEKDPMLIIESIKEYTITKIHFVPSMFVFFINALKNGNLTNDIKSLDTIFCSGESLPTSLVKEYNRLDPSFPLAKVVNLYGPTEATVDVSYYNCPDFINDTDRIFIGRPIDNTELYIVNSNLIVQPVGIKGELLITGTNLAVGYLNNEELTSNQFVKFIKPNGEQVIAYKTGDLAILNYNGEIEYIGRKDNQIKIRGIRIELGEIEAKIGKHPKISTVAVSLVNDKENKTLIAYVVLKISDSVTERTLLNELKNLLSPIMMPSRIIFMKNLPLTTSGKIDRKKLPKPQKHFIHEKLTKPETIIENELFCLWNELLKTDNIQVTDNFYDIGGNSLLAIKLSMQISEKFSVESDVISIFEYPTIKDYALYLEILFQNKQNPINTDETERISRNNSRRIRYGQNRNSIK